MTFHGRRFRRTYGDDGIYYQLFPIGHHKLFLEQRLELARYGAMRAVTLREKIICLEQEINEFNNIKIAER